MSWQIRYPVVTRDGLAADIYKRLVDERAVREHIEDGIGRSFEKYAEVAFVIADTFVKVYAERLAKEANEATA